MRIAVTAPSKNRGSARRRKRNLKILLDLAIHRGELTLEGRNQLLQECATDVVGHVLYDNYLQAQVLSQEIVVGAQRIEAYEDLMVQLEEEGELDREVEFMPGTEEMLQRRADGVGMVRPELAVLLAYAKRSIAEALLDSDIPDSPYLVQDLERYSPRRWWSGSDTCSRTTRCAASSSPRSPRTTS